MGLRGLFLGGDFILNLLRDVTDLNKFVFVVTVFESILVAS